MDKRLLVLFLVAFLILPIAPQASNDTAHGRLVVVIVLDAYNPYYNANMTLLNSIATRSVPLEVQYPAVTIVSHMTFVTGYLPNVTNIVNTYMFDPAKLKSDRSDAQNALISREDVLNVTTLYGEAYQNNYLTALVTAKPKLLELLGTEGVATVVDKYPGYVDYANVTNLMYVNSRLMNETKKIIESRVDEIYNGERGYLLVNLPGTDYIGHNYGPYSPEYQQILMQEQQLVYNFVQRLMGTKIRDRTMVIALGDHSMAAVSENAAIKDTTTGMYTFADLAVNGIINLGIGASGAGVLLYLLHNDTQTMQEAVNILRNSGKVDGIRTSVPISGANGTLADIGLNTPYAGDMFVSMKPPYYFSDGTLKGAHGGYATKITHAWIFTGRPDILQPFDKLTSVDVAALSFGFLGLPPLKGSLANPDKVVKPEAMSNIEANLPPFVAAGESFDVVIQYTLPEGVSGNIVVTVYDENGNQVYSKTVSVSSTGATKVTISGLSSGTYQVVVSLYVDNQEVAGEVYVINAQQPVETEVKQPVGYMALSLVLMILIIIGAIFLAKRIE